MFANLFNTFTDTQEETSNFVDRISEAAETVVGAAKTKVHEMSPQAKETKASSSSLFSFFRSNKSEETPAATKSEKQESTVPEPSPLAFLRTQSTEALSVKPSEPEGLIDHEPEEHPEEKAGNSIFSIFSYAQEARQEPEEPPLALFRTQSAEAVAEKLSEPECLLFHEESCGDGIVKSITDTLTSAAHSYIDASGDLLAARDAVTEALTSDGDEIYYVSTA